MVESMIDDIDDLRQGVTQGGHAVLDMLEFHVTWAHLHTVEQQLQHACTSAGYASHLGHDPQLRRQLAVEAAARLIDAIDRMDRGIACEGTGV
jgi:hypothetical protein